MLLKVITRDATSAITSAAAKLHLRIDGSSEDTWLTQALASVHRMAEAELRRAVMPITYELQLDAFPAAEIELPQPAASITSITYTDSAGSAQTLSSGAYRLVGNDDSAAVFPAVSGAAWPITGTAPDAVRVRFVGGWADAASVPAPVVSWMLLQLGALYENRAAIDLTAKATDLPSRFVGHHLDDFRIYP